MPLVVTMAMLFAACHHPENDTNPNQAVSVQTQKIEYKEFAAPITSSGIITSSKEARLSFKTGGIIARMYVEEGQIVHKGQLLATLNMTEVNAQVGQLQTSYKKASRDYQRLGNLFIDSATTREQWENAETTLRAAEESLKIASFNKQYSAIYATETGTVIKKLANEGEMVTPGSPVYIINSVGKNDWVVRVGVSDKDWARLQLNDKAEISLDAYPGLTFAGSVSKIEQAAEMGSGTFAVEIQVNPGNQKFASGLVGRVHIFPSNLQKVFMVPIEALHEADENSGNVFSVEPKTNTAVMHRVQIAYILEDKVAISSGLQNIPEVITQGTSYLSDKIRVKVQH